MVVGESPLAAVDFNERCLARLEPSFNEFHERRVEFNANPPATEPLGGEQRCAGASIGIEHDIIRSARDRNAPPGERQGRQGKFRGDRGSVRTKSARARGEGGIRTLDAFPHTHFPGVLLRPLGHLSGFALSGRAAIRSSLIPAHALAATVAPFRAWRGSQPDVAGGPDWTAIDPAIRAAQSSGSRWAKTGRPTSVAA